MNMLSFAFYLVAGMFLNVAPSPDGGVWIQTTRTYGCGAEFTDKQADAIAQAIVLAAAVDGVNVSVGNARVRSGGGGDVVLRVAQPWMGRGRCSVVLSGGAHEPGRVAKWINAAK